MHTEVGMVGQIKAATEKQAKEKHRISSEFPWSRHNFWAKTAREVKIGFERWARVCVSAWDQHSFKRVPRAACDQQLRAQQ